MISSSTKPEHQRGIQVQGEYLRYLRKSRGWTQSELAERAGYCERLIRKAEKDGFLLPETIDVLAETLSTTDELIEPSTLWLLPRSKIAFFLRLLRGQMRITESAVAAIATSNVSIECKGVSFVPFSGKYRQLAGFQEWLHRFRKTLADDQSSAGDHAVMVDRQQAFLHSSWIFQNGSRCSSAIEFDIRIGFFMGRVDEMTVTCDTIDFIEFFNRAACHQDMLLS